MKNGASSYRRFVSGDEAAFDEIIKTYRHRLIFFIDRIVSDTEAAEDIAVDVFTYILLHPGRYNEKNALSTYLFMLAKSRALDYLRHKKVHREVPLSDAEPVTSTLYDPYSELLDSARKRVLNDALGKLPTQMQTAVHLIYFEELSYKETAKIMKKTPKQVDNLIYRAKGLLREILKREVDWLL